LIRGLCDLLRPRLHGQADQEHADLVRLYRERDAEAVIELTLQHLRSTLAAIEKTHEGGAV
jgi:DNA-binding GntR family transcriptional regulator